MHTSEQNHNPDHHKNRKKEIEEKKKQDFKEMLSTVGLFIFAPLFALFMIVFVFQSYVVEGSSMEPTMHNNNRVFILKMPKTWAKLTNKNYIPERNEIIVFKKPSEPDMQLIKRVIGLPGERVIVKDGEMKVFNKEFPDGFDPAANTDYGPNLEETTGEADITLGENEIFVAGDNRLLGASLDSRTGLGAVPVDNIVGRLWIRYWPFKEIQTFSISYQLIQKFF